MNAQSAVGRVRLSGTLIRYIAVGLLSLIVDAGTLWLLYEVAGRSLWLSATVGFWLSFAVNFAANKYLTFGSRTDGSRQMARYSALVALNYLANLGIVTGLVAVGVAAVGAKVVAVALLAGVNFVAYRQWVFRS